MLDSWTEINLNTHIFFNMVDEINKLIEPIIEYFGLNTFNYFKTYNDDSQIRLSNTPDWMRHYINNKLYLQSIFELPAYNYQRSRIIWSNIDSHNYILQEATKFNINHGITFVEPCKDGCEFYFLGTYHDNKEIINKYLSNFTLLEKFITNLHMAKASIIAQIEPYRVKARDWLNNKLEFKQYTDIIDKLRFLAKVYNYQFTPRELECIPLLIKGCSAKQVAEHLNISFRTVESYINNLKYKTKTNNKNEMLSILYEKFG